MTPLRLGYKASAEQFSPRELLEFGVAAERCGFDSVMVSDHFQPWRHNGGHAPFSFAWLAALAVRTERIVMGTSVVTPTFRYHPSVVAQAMGTIGCLAPGRLILGVGSGESLNEVAPTGIEWPPFKERFGRLRESIELMRRLWSEERVSYDGEYFRTEQATIYDRPDEMIPIYIAAAGPSASKLAGRVGDGLICTSGKTDDVYDEKILPNFDEGIRAAGRDGASIDRMIEIKISYDDDIDAARQATRYWAALALKPEEKTGVEDPLAMEKLADALPIERAASRWLLATDPETVAEGLEPYMKRGFRHLVFHSPTANQSAFLERFSAEVLPELRKRFAGAGITSGPLAE